MYQALAVSPGSSAPASRDGRGSAGNVGGLII
jgi:hypothetical protein